MVYLGVVTTAVGGDLLLARFGLESDWSIFLPEESDWSALRAAAVAIRACAAAVAAGMDDGLVCSL